LCSDIPVRFSMAARQRIFFREKRQICYFNWSPWQRPSSDRQMNAGFIKPLHGSTNPEIFEIALFSSSLDRFAPRSTIKKN